MTTPDFRPTHVVPQDGLPAWEEPDVSLPTEPLDPLLPVRLIDRRGDWGQVLCANGWSAWVDGRLLVSVPGEPPAAGQPMARTADPRPMLARVEESLSQYRRAAEDLTAGRTDGQGFHRRTRGLRVGMVVDGEAVWLYDAEHERWVYCDGTRLATYATSSSPAAEEPPPREPTQVTARPPASPPTPPEPTRVVAPAAPDDERPDASDPTRVVGPDAGRPPEPAPPADRAAPPEPTRVATPPTATPSAPPDDEEPTAPAEPTRVVAPPTTAPSAPPDDEESPAPEPTRVVTPPTATTSPAGPPHGGQTTPPAPTRVVGGVPEEPDDAEGGGGDGGGNDDRGRDREATRIVRPGDRTAPRPPARPGDG
ncbi:hypothetical protein [Streptomyces chryseus]|uniref:Uncharacterized protein n=1 Tax=Streptomyces chryseus TaxID=68186 RepID=A0ABQ3DJM3_9ACTN|nr:hypothetical protein [Streptomyces chryseus]GHB01770.1 hypothetical protein GCM10010346_25860 [Streptomyces chryseus]